MGKIINMREWATNKRLRDVAAYVRKVAEHYKPLSHHDGEKSAAFKEKLKSDKAKK